MTNDAPIRDAPRPVLLAYDYPPNDGGISRLGAGLAEELARRGDKALAGEYFDLRLARDDAEAIETWSFGN